MGIDIYLRWQGMTEGERAAQHGRPPDVIEYCGPTGETTYCSEYERAA